MGIQEHHCHTRRFRLTEESAETKEKLKENKALVDLLIAMKYNKKNITHTVNTSVTHNKNLASKFKVNDYPERNLVSFIKLVGKTHISKFMCLGTKKQKIQKKTKKD